ncbi:MAG: CDP-alcohol phosphatidyltransferase family protein [Planctomycetes bacterium]|nr:CDP-alcohol phosphatidyltransferase family protein [Planctomycetota bacterium]
MSQLTVSHRNILRHNLANLITLGRIPLCFSAFFCALIVMQDNPNLYPAWGFWGEILLIATALTDYFDGMVARKLNIVSRLGPLSDQVMDKIVYCIIFPTIAVGMMRVAADESMMVTADKNMRHLHVTVVLVLCVTLLVRDHYVNFLRSIVDRHQGDSGVSQVGKLRTILSLPTACILYGYCFCSSDFTSVWYLNAVFAWPRYLDASYFVVLELFLFVINLVSAIYYTRRYGKYFMNEICENDESLRRKILSIFPNSLTLMNAMMGIIAVILSWRGNFFHAFVLIMFAAIFDKLDGAAARKLGLTDLGAAEGKKTITFGTLLDDLADGISFCIAPAIIAWAYLRGTPGVLFLLIYPVCGVARLVTFTLDKRPVPGFFKGLPSPAAALMAVAVVQACAHFFPEPGMAAYLILAVYILLGLLMNIPFILYVHTGRLMGKSKALSRFIWLAFLVAVISRFGGLLAIALMLVYIFSPLFIKPAKYSESLSDCPPNAHD